MDELSRLVATPVVIEFKGERYAVSPLSLKDLATIGEYLKGYIATEAKKVVALLQAAGAPKEHLDQVWKQTLVDMKFPLASSFMDDIEPLVELFYLSLRRQSPAFTRETCREMVDSPEVVAQIKKAINELDKTDNSLIAQAKKLSGPGTE
jgi:hypothetical protein